MRIWGSRIRQYTQEVPKKCTLYIIAIVHNIQICSLFCHFKLIKCTLRKLLVSLSEIVGIDVSLFKILRTTFRGGKKKRNNRHTSLPTNNETERTRKGRGGYATSELCHTTEQQQKHCRTLAISNRKLIEANGSQNETEHRLRCSPSFKLPRQMVRTTLATVLTTNSFRHCLFRV